MAGHSRSKNGVLSHAYVPAIRNNLSAVIAGPDPAIHEATPHTQPQGLCTLHFLMDARVKPAHDP
jgi:hypothetical protein